MRAYTRVPFYDLLRLQVVNALLENDAHVKTKRVGVIPRRRKAAGNGLVPTVHSCAALHPVAQASASV